MIIKKTARFYVIEAVPRLALRDVTGPAGLALLRRHGFLIVTSLGSEFERRLEALRLSMLEWFRQSSETKEDRVGGVYVSERGVPMFRVGYEAQARIRECFRIAVAKPLWPGESRAARDAIVLFRKLADRVLAAAVPRPRRAEEEEVDEDFSVAYAFYYPNTDAYGLDNNGTLVGPHADPSLVVVAPVADVPGLYVFDPATQSWLSVEIAARPRRELVLFSGKALETASRGAIPACVHKVLKTSKTPRLSFVFEQKYASFYSHLRHFGD
ncbi:hypothetical protein CTAYLR_003573 [Chrysophaeum taylorii]|uniref:Fe2OG dioxygenase domain-containing protein n=1 Tax=Chrysophaeum taylorii TaxID=2483200 RepID=A0AAD7XT29_9STRA|nr:hypothetical protein CTAYLR_003573 [Chrysophaeum taylorii]